MSFFLDKRDVTEHPELDIGEKARQLCWLSSQGFNVPDWRLISLDSFSRAILNREDKEQLRYQNDFIFELHSLLENWRRDGYNSYIIRTSMEGGNPSSREGIQSSFPNLKNIDLVLQAMKSCFSSFESQVFKTYLSSKGIDHSLLRMSVLLQVMIDGENSGVLFTADPRDGARRRFLLSSRGRKSNKESFIASNDYIIDPHSFTVEEDARLNNKACGFSKTGIDGLVRESKNNQGLSLESKAPQGTSLPKATIKELCLLGRQITELKSHPQEIEWTVSKGNIHLVQIRKIMDLGKDLSAESPQGFDKRSPGEFLEGRVLPLSFSFHKSIYQLKLRTALKLIGLSSSLRESLFKSLPQVLIFAKGRVYFNHGLWDKNLNKTSLRLSWQFLSREYQLRKFRENFSRNYQTISAKNFYWMGPEDIFREYQKLQSSIFEKWNAPMLNDLFLRGKGKRIRECFKKLNCSGLLVDLSVRGSSSKLAPFKKILFIAESVRENPKLFREFSKASKSEVLDVLASDPIIKSKIIEFLSIYGDQVPGELKLETKTYRQDKLPLADLLKSYVSDPDLSWSSFEYKISLRQEKAQLNLESAVKKLNFLAARVLKRDISKYQKALEFQTLLDLDFSRAIGLARQMFLELGRKWQEQDLLEHKEDIFFLQISEIEEIIFAGALRESPKELIQLRKSQFKRWSGEEVQKENPKDSGNKDSSNWPPQFSLESVSFFEQV